MVAYMEFIAGGISVLLIATLHILYPVFEKITGDRRLKWTSLAGGAAIGYVFLYLLPKLSDYTIIITRANQGGWELFNYRTFHLALVGFIAYQTIYWLSNSDRPTFKHWGVVNCAGFSLYNILTGYIIAHPLRPGIIPFVLGVTVLGLHFLGVNHQLRHWHQYFFDRYMRWLMAISIIGGWIAGVCLHLPKPILIYTTSFLAGAIITNVMTEDIPEEGEGHYLYFLLGIFALIVATMIVRSIPKYSF
jgi:hypothetical protein